MAPPQEHRHPTRAEMAVSWQTGGKGNFITSTTAAVSEGSMYAGARPTGNVLCYQFMKLPENEFMYLLKMRVSDKGNVLLQRVAAPDCVREALPAPSDLSVANKQVLPADVGSQSKKKKLLSLLSSVEAAGMTEGRQSLVPQEASVPASCRVLTFSVDNGGTRHCRPHGLPNGCYH